MAAVTTKSSSNGRRSVGVSHSPKRPRRERSEAVDIFPYYAGYSYEWAVSTIAREAREDAMILDPWNGSGTTTLASHALGIRSLGIDLNPAANVIAHGRLAGRSELSEGLPMPQSIAPSVDDPLEQWLSSQLSARVRQWQSTTSELNQAMGAVLTVALFRVLRQLTKSFEGSNPTWVRRAQELDQRISLDLTDFDALLVEEYASVCRLLDGREGGDGPASILTANSTSIPLRDSVADLIIGSPPYLTRIDYAVAYSRELAVLGIESRTAPIRSQLMGTTKIRRAPGEHTFPSPVSEVLDQISSHESKESSGYYLKQAQQYFIDLVASLAEVTRVAKPKSSLILVVQDSYYKDVPIPLGNLVASLLERRGWDLEAVEEYGVPRLVTTMNKSAKAYTKGPVKESVIRSRRNVE
jgi:hypothetical protein